jgi:hypothetical protein
MLFGELIIQAFYQTQPTNWKVVTTAIFKGENAQNTQEIRGNEVF